MSVIKITVNDQALYVTDKPVIASQGVNENYIQCTFSADWADFGVVAMFYKEDNEATVYESVVDGDGKALVPHEVTQTPGRICIGLAGVKGDIVHTSEILKYKIVKGLYTDGEHSEPPSPGIYEQMLALAGQMREAFNEVVTTQSAAIEQIRSEQTALRSELTTEQETFEDRITGQVDTFIGDHSGTYGQTTLWESSDTNGILAKDTSVTLSEAIESFDFVDIYSFDGDNNAIDTIPVDALLPDPGYTIRWTNVSTQSVKLDVIESRLTVTGTTFTIANQYQYQAGQSNPVHQITQANKSNYTGQFGILKIVGRKLVENAEVADIRVGADGTVYQSAGAAIRTQFANITGVYKLSVPGSSAVLSGNLTSGDFAKAYAAFTSGKGVYAVKDGEVYQLTDASSSLMSYCNVYIGAMRGIKKIVTYSNDTFEMAINFINGSFVSYDNTNSGLSATNVQDALDGLNERLEQLEQGGTGADVPSEVRQAIYTLLTKGLYSDTGLTDEKAILQSWATEVTEVTISQSAISISGAATSQLTATTSPAGGLVTWSSSNPAVATVSSTGLVTGVSNGTATITASCGGKKATCTATVTGFATLTGITAVYSGGSVYNTATLNDLKSDLVVTASYDNSTTATVTDYTLSGSLAIGTNTITVSYGGKTDTFNVTVTQDLTGMLYSFDFRNNNLTDDVNGVVAVTNATQGANGISFTAGSQYIVLDTSTTRSLAGLRVEIDIASMSDSSDTSGNYNARLFSVTTNSSYATHNGADNFLWRKGGVGWYFYNGGWSSEYIDPVSYPGSYFSGKTVSLEFDSAGYCTVSVDGTELITYGIKTTKTGYFVIGGSNSDWMSILSPTISAVRVYEVAA